MNELDESAIRNRVQEALTTLPENRYGLHVEDVHLVDGRWWVFLDADIEQKLEDQDVKVTVAAA